MGWLTGWAKRIKLTIDYTLVDSALTDFPVMLKITDESVFDEITSADDRYKIAITASDGTTQQYVEVERWDQTNKYAILHTLVPSVSSTADTIIYLYYDAGHADNTDYVGDTQIGNSGYTWLGDSFEAVHHMATTPTATLLESTLNANNATSGGSMTAADLIDGLVGKAIDFDGQDDRMDLASAISLTGAFSIQVLGKITSYVHEPGIACNGSTWASGRIAIKAAANALWWGSADTVSLTEALPTDTWFLLTITRDASNNIKVYKNGTDITSGTPSFSGTLSIDRICDNPDNVTQKAWYGPVDEFRIVSSCLSAAWIKATYYSLIDGLIKARDCGESWTDLGQQYSQIWITGLIYLGGGIALAGTYDGGKILRSTDYGANWSDLGQQYSQTTIRPFAYCGKGIALAGTSPGGKILRSTNYGATWSDLGQQYSQSYILSLVYLESGIVLAGTSPGGKILRSTDYGATWTDLGQQFSQAMIVRLASLGSGIVLAGTGAAADYESGVIDTQQGTLRAATVAAGALFWDTGQDFSDYVGATGSFKPYALIATDSGAKTAWGYIGEEGTGETLGGELITNGDFTNWTGDNPDNWSLNFTETGSTYVTENPVGQCQLVKGDATNPHIYQSSVFTTGKLYKISFDIKSISGTLQFYNGGYIANYTTPGIKTFYMTATASNINFLLEVSGNATIDDVSVKEVTALPADQGVKIYSTKVGSTQSWANIESGFSPNNIVSYEVRQVVSDGHILRSTDHGLTWTDLGQQFLQTEIRSLGYCGDGIALAGTYPNGKILRSIDYGQTWTDLGQQASQGQICSMAYLETGIALAGTGPDGKILRSVADILRAEEQSIYSMPAGSLPLRPKHPIMIPFYIPVPAVAMAISRRSPAWRWAVNIANQHKATLVYLFQLGGWQDNQPDITIPVSSVYIRKSRVSARHLPGASVSTWAAGTFYEVGDVVRPTGGGGGFRYECIKAGWSNSTGSTLSTLPDWQPRTLYFSADRIFVDNNYVYKVAQVGRSGFSEPTWGADEVAEGGWVGHWGLPGLWEWVGVIWRKISSPALQVEPHWPTIIGAIVNDNQVLWRNIGHDAIWGPGVAYQSGEIIYPSWDNGFSYKCVTGGTSGEAEPDWPLAIGVHITDGGVQWVCYERTEFFLSTDFRVVIPDAATWAAAVAARPKGEMRLYRGYRWASDAGQIELLASIPLTEIDVNYETRGNGIALVGRDLSQTTYKGGERQEDLEGLSDYALVGGFARATCAINHFVRPGDFVTVEAAQAGISNTFESGQIIINIAMRGTGIAESMYVEQWGG